MFHLGCICIGNLFPHRVSFLLSHRYYAGNWAYTIWLFRDKCAEALEQNLTMSAQIPQKQLSHFYSTQVVDFLLSKVIAFRMMHLLGRMLRTLIPLSVTDISKYRWFDGELIAGLTLGWNFGDGHLSGLQLLDSIQKECDFAEGDLRCILVESQPIHTNRVRWLIADAAVGVVHRGETSIDIMRSGQPWDIASNNIKLQPYFE